MRPEPYIRATRGSGTLVDERGLLRAGIPHTDRYELVIPGDWPLTTHRGLTVATHTRRTAAPILAPGFLRDALCPGDYDGDAALRFEGYTAPLYDRPGDARRQDWDANLVLHDNDGRTDGCPTAPQPWIDAVIAYLNRLAVDGAWNPRRHPDGRWCVSFELVEAT